MNNIILKDTEGKIITSNEVECKIYSQSDYIKILPETVGKSIKNDKIGNDYECDIFEVSLDRSLSKVDKLDIEIAIVSGVLSGLVDSFFIGKFSLDEANEWGDKKVEEKDPPCENISSYDFPYTCDIIMLTKLRTIEGETQWVFTKNCKRAV